MTGNVHITGLGWVTPAGIDLGEVWARLESGESPAPTIAINPETGARHEYLAVPEACTAGLARHPRLRRSSRISYFAAAAGQAALTDACVELNAQTSARTALVLAISDGGVIYTRKFYDQVTKQGANAASPLLFPETVYNAPASHLAALLGLDGATYTLVGDNSVGLAALKFSEQLLNLGEMDQVLLVGAEEIDWVICEAYRDWRLARTKPARQGAPWKALLGEGAAALLLAREGPIAIPGIHSGVSFRRGKDAFAALGTVLADLAAFAPIDRVVSGAQNAAAAAAEEKTVASYFPEAIRSVQRPKTVFGEAPGASALLQLVAAALAVRYGDAERVLTPVVGFNQQASAAVVARGTS